MRRLHHDAPAQAVAHDDCWTVHHCGEYRREVGGVRVQRVVAACRPPAVAVPPQVIGDDAMVSGQLLGDDPP